MKYRFHTNGARLFFTGLVLFFWGLCLFTSTMPTWATPCVPLNVTVTSNEGDNSPGSLGDAINQINANAPCGGTIDLSSLSGQTIILSSDLPTLTQSVTFTNSGASVVINGGNSYQVFNSAGVSLAISGVQVVDGNLTGTGDVSSPVGTVQFNGSAASGNPVSLSSNSLSLSNSTLALEGGSGAPNGGAGGSADLSVTGSMSADPSTLTVAGGTGADNSGGDDGAGGAATVNVGSLILAGDTGGLSTYQVAGGNGGTASGTSGNGGAGGDAIFTSSGPVSVYYTGLNLTGGTGGDSAGGVGGSGGSAALMTGGPLTVDSGLVSVGGGTGGSSHGGDGGNGGNASVSLGSGLILVDSYTFSGLYVAGGNSGSNIWLNGHGAGGAAGSAVLSVSGAVSMDTSFLAVTGGDAGYGYALEGAAGGNGGGASVFLGSLSAASSAEAAQVSVAGGGGGTDYYQGGGGNGGTADLSVTGAVSDDSEAVNVSGGAGGYSYYANGGNGGDALVSIGSDLNVTGNNYAAAFTVAGGKSGGNFQGNSGAGGDADLWVSGAVSVDSSLVSVGGGLGKFSAQGDGDNGGNAWVTTGSDLSVLDGSNIIVAGGSAQTDYPWVNSGSKGTGGSGGWASLAVDGAVSLDSSLLNVAGGTGADSYGNNAGNGGNALASIGTGLVVTADKSSSGLIVAGGNGGNSYGWYAAGTGGAGGSAFLAVNGSVSVDSSAVSVIGGTGGNGSSAGGGSIGNGGNGGSAGVSIGTVLTLGDSSSLVLAGGIGGNSDTYNGGNGGIVSLTASGLTLGAGSALSMVAGTGGTGAVSNGLTGSADAVVGDLEGAGFITMGGLAASLRVQQGSFSGVIAGNEGLDVAGGGPLTLSGTNTYSGGTTLEAGTLNLGNNSALGTGNLVLHSATTLQAGTDGLAVTNAVSLNGSDTFDTNGDGLSLSGVLSGTGSLTKISAGILTLAGANSYSGGTTLVAGTLSLGNNSALGTGSLVLEDGTTLRSGASSLPVTNTVFLNGSDTFDTNGNGSSLAGILEGFGGLDIAGNGAVTLTEVNTYTGGTDLIGGTLVAANSHALGTGSVVVNGGTLSLNGPMTLNIGGDYTQSAPGTLQMGMGGIDAGAWDVLEVSGAASLAGTLSLVSENGYHLHIHGTEDFEILTAGSVEGTFNTITNMVTADSVTLIYQPTDILLQVTGPTFRSLGVTPNQAAIGGALDVLNEKFSDPAMIQYLNTLSDSDLLGVYAQISPAVLTPMYRISFSSSQVEAEMVDQRLDQLFGGAGGESKNISWNGEGPLFAGRHSAAREEAIAEDLQPQRLGVFMDGMGDFGTVTGDSNAQGYQYSTGGMVAGLDYHFSKEWAVGLMLGYTQSGTSQSTGMVNVTGGQFGLYGGWKGGALHAEALAFGGINSYATQRDSFGGTASGRAQGYQYSGQAGAGWDWTLGKAKVGPFLSAQYTRVDINGFNETGSQTPLSYPSQGAGCLLSDLGMRVSRDWAAGGVVLAPSLSAAWEHVYQGNLDSLSAAMEGGGNFTVEGPALGTDALVLAAGLDAKFGRDFKAYVSYQGKAGMTNYSGQNLTGGVDFGF